MPTRYEINAKVAQMAVRVSDRRSITPRRRPVSGHPRYEQPWSPTRASASVIRGSLGEPDVSLFAAGRIKQCQAGVLGTESGGYGQIVINRYHNGSWGTPRVASNASAVNPEINLSDR
jgi:hypothetical protein